MTPAAPRRYLTVKAVAERYALSRSQVRKLAAEGTLPGLKVGDRWRFLPERLDAFDDANTRLPARPAAPDASAAAEPIPLVGRPPTFDVRACREEIRALRRMPADPASPARASSRRPRGTPDPRRAAP